MADAAAIRQARESTDDGQSKYHRRRSQWWVLRLSHPSRHSDLGTLRRSRMVPLALIDDLCGCLCIAPESKETSLQIFGYDQRRTFRDLISYYGERAAIDCTRQYCSLLLLLLAIDTELSQNDMIQTDEGTNFYSLKRLLGQAM